ncbi:MAG: hypothetical protein CTY18_02010 [Methylomonas sp.]|nr:MAG: hypothetical protein CTY18_02010 [Methylomonas sp.]
MTLNLRCEVLEMLSRLLKQRDAPAYLGMSEPVFNQRIHLFTDSHACVATQAIRSLKDTQ